MQERKGEDEGHVCVPIIIVESHHHVLEHVHTTIRKKKQFGKTWSMLHFDAHPDLACPSHCPAKLCFTPRQTVCREEEETTSSAPKDLYEMLDSTSSGIAEWILPLVLAADLRTIEWVRSSFSTQIPIGSHHFRVGTTLPPLSEMTRSTIIDNNNTSFLDLPLSSRIHVDWNIPYYIDDDSVVDTADLVLAQPLLLHVTELADSAHQTKGSLEPTTSCNSGIHPSETTMWMLDICLDYFTCFNPYLSDIDQTDPTTSQALLELIRKASCFQDSESETIDLVSMRKHAVEFRELLEVVLTTTDQVLMLALKEEMAKYYTSTDECSQLLDNLQMKLEGNDELKSHVLQCLPYWNMPHAPDSNNMEKIQDMISSVENAVQNYSDHPPFLISIARSSEDGFTPAAVVEDIQASVLAMLERVYGCSAKSSEHQGVPFFLLITRDYGEWEGSTLLF